MANNPKMFLVVLHEDISKYAMNDIIQKTIDTGSNSAYHMICSEVDSEGRYFAATASAANGETRRVLLNHSFVVAVLELVNLQNPIGFHQGESL